VLVLHALSQLLNEHVVDPAPTAVHADFDAAPLEHLGEVIDGEFAALIAVENLRQVVLGDRHPEASTHKSGATPIDTRCASTLRVAQSMTAIK